MTFSYCHSDIYGISFHTWLLDDRAVISSQGTPLHYPSIKGRSLFTIKGRLLPKPSVSNPLDNRAHPMANTNQALDLKGIHREMHGIIEQIRIMNEINARLIQHLATNNPPSPIAPVPEEADRSHPNFMRCKVKQKNVSHPFTIHQKEGRNLKDYIKRFNQAVLEVEGPNDKVAVMAMIEGLQPGDEEGTTTKGRSLIPVGQTIVPLNTSIAQVLVEIKNEDFVKWHGKIKTNLLKKNKNKYFDRSWPDSPDRGYGDNRPIVGDIQTIHRWFGSRGCLSSSRKRHAKEANGQTEEKVYNLSTLTTGTHQPITFTNDYLRGLHLSHDDTLVISAKIDFTHFTPLWSDLEEVHQPPWMDQIAFDLGGGTSLDYSLAGLPPRMTNATEDQSNHFHLSPDDEIFHFNRGRRGEGRPKDC
ncbi:hypothetical protein Acr_29g0008230 [Actinidia rufa]|uniref:Uncharacterized protein n=1 Tax=Actinidia rufa TaxID=165716 RepID=A0A7J0HFD2_9ERIC|nr:hypothetical protein Acr_29g0008230 [Actinidia rufa]